MSRTPPPPSGNRGLYVETVSNNATITASGQIDVAGVGGGNHAIKAFVNGTVGPGDASVTYTGAGLLPFDLRSSGTNSTVIQAESLNGNASIDASGNMSSSGQSNDMFFGLFAQTGAAGQPGDASVIYRSGTITVQGSNSIGIFAGVQRTGRPKLPPCPAPRSSSAATTRGILWTRQSLPTYMAPRRMAGR